MLKLLSDLHHLGFMDIVSLGASLFSEYPHELSLPVLSQCSPKLPSCNAGFSFLDLEPRRQHTTHGMAFVYIYPCLEASTVQLTIGLHALPQGFEFRKKKTNITSGENVITNERVPFYICAKTPFHNRALSATGLPNIFPYLQFSPVAAETFLHHEPSLVGTPSLSLNTDDDGLT
ncbi:hypothetical protein VTK73DRAFT_113 [Phialemonium thermophilum]|uniref:Uncharacterized protein n=1 Tax=Phialemonium thermophilum TaxID=223376 RepID=A0ABR3Y4Q4_9PEZI